ncbi:peptide-methionine (R)-S-oxide reductase [Sphingomonas guangdongensis]|uniref:peptide-methionine (R)-S-oxide reductase n=2 Tax=Sphingomonas guangdongensis TaxID=1141890 RepID=A0A285QAV1_9SPHN|nr:peptide-methionine (R)-S-oxide reductase [Sphingomonas guangdongensis]
MTGEAYYIPHMTDRRTLLASAVLGTAGVLLPRSADARYEVTLPDAEWRKRLTPAAYQVLRHEDTERPYSSPLNGEKRSGVFACAGCKLPLFTSRTKFESGTGWPSFWAPLPNAVATRTDRTLGMARTEVHCRRCGGHLGHVFDDGPKPTGKRYCMNGVAMTFAPRSFG